MRITNNTNAVFCEKALSDNHASYAHLTHKNVDRFRNGSVNEFYSLKVSQSSKVHASSHEHLRCGNIEHLVNRTLKLRQTTSY